MSSSVMASRERVLCAIDHKETDRIPRDFDATPEKLDALTRELASTLVAYTYEDFEDNQNPGDPAFDRTDDGAPNGVCREVACRVFRQAVPPNRSILGTEQIKMT